MMKDQEYCVSRPKGKEMVPILASTEKKNESGDIDSLSYKD